jgi:hypothetical protein
MSDATLARMEHGKYVGVREESRRDGVWALRKRTLYTASLLCYTLITPLRDIPNKDLHRMMYRSPLS